MFQISYCPYCGHSVNKDELFCVSCGKLLPKDMNQRNKHNQAFNKLWYIPLSLVVVVLISFFTYSLFLENRTSKAKDFYEQGEEFLLEENETDAEKAFQKALDYKPNFPQAETALKYTHQATVAQHIIDDTSSEINKDNYQKALSLIDEAERKVKSYTGPAVSQLITNLTAHRNNIKIKQLNHLLENEPSIDELKMLLWEADAIKTEKAKEMTEMIREDIIDYTFAYASENLNNKQFKSAKAIVQDGLRYAPESKKLQSLQTSVEKEKMAYETTIDQRLEQAINTENNESDAIRLDFITIKSDQQNNVIVKGEVNSIATIPINSIKINYSITTNQGERIVKNDVFVYPETLEPDETGKFDFTHYDMDKNAKNLEVVVNKISWFTD